MNGATKNYNQTIVENFIKQCNPYKPSKSPNIDLRAYARYIKENSLTADKITPEIMEKFMIKNSF